jgi:predicted nucleic acid-binding protein
LGEVLRPPESGTSSRLALAEGEGLVKAFDTSILLGLLEGDPAVQHLVRRLRGHEIATTEGNLLELGYLAGLGPVSTRASRKEALERLRSKITVLPIDARATDAGIRRVGKGGERLPPCVLAMLGALEAGGCDELFTREVAQELGKWRFKITRLSQSHSK